MNTIITDGETYLEYHWATHHIWTYNKDGLFVDGVYQTNGPKKPLISIQDIIKGHNPSCEYPIVYKTI